MSGLSCGLVGLPNVGKSTLFNALTKNQAGAANFPFCTIDPNVGIVEVFDPRLPKLAQLVNSEKTLFAQLAVTDIAGLVKGASKGEGLGNQFLANIRETDAILHVVRCFEDENVIHVEGKINPIDDIEVINLELILADLQMVENSITKLEKQARIKKDLAPSVTILKRIEEHLNNNLPLRSMQLTEEERELIKQYNFITSKPVIYAANIGEEDIESMSNPFVEKVKDYAQKEGSVVFPICGKLEYELAQLSEEESQEYLESLGIEEKALQRLVRLCFHTLGLITFITCGEKETRAWTIRQNTTAPEAAGKIHTDLQKGFIRAEVITYEDFISCGGRAEAKEKAKARMEGKEYIVKDGDVILFFHN